MHALQALKDKPLAICFSDCLGAIARAELPEWSVIQASKPNELVTTVDMQQAWRLVGANADTPTILLGEGIGTRGVRNLLTRNLTRSVVGLGAFNIPIDPDWVWLEWAQWAERAKAKRAIMVATCLETDLATVKLFSTALDVKRGTKPVTAGTLTAVCYSAVRASLEGIPALLGAFRKPLPSSEPPSTWEGRQSALERLAVASGSDPVTP